MRRLPSGTLVPLSRNTFIAILQPPDPTRVRSGTLCVPRRLVFPFPGTFPLWNVPAFPHQGMLRHFFVPRRLQFSSPGTFPHQNVPAYPHLGALRYPLRAQAAGIFLFVNFPKMVYLCNGQGSRQWAQASIHKLCINEHSPLLKHNLHNR